MVPAWSGLHVLRRASEPDAFPTSANREISAHLSNGDDVQRSAVLAAPRHVGQEQNGSLDKDGHSKGTFLQTGYLETSM